MADPEQRLGAALRIIEDYPNLHMGPTISFVLGALCSSRSVWRQRARREDARS
jgi:hypothetical protein